MSLTCLHGNAIMAMLSWQCYHGNSSSACDCRCARKKGKEGEPVKEWVEAANAIYLAGLQQFPESTALHIAYSNFISTYKKNLTVSGQQGLSSPPTATCQAAAIGAAFHVQQGAISDNASSSAGAIQLHWPAA